MKFQQWLTEQSKREDFVGSFARDMADIELGKFAHGRGADEHKKWANVVTRRGSLRQIRDFNSAWSEFIAYQEEESEEVSA